MKILQIVTRSEPGGAQAVVRTLSESLVARGHEVTIAAGPEGDGAAWAGMDPRIGTIVLPDLHRRVHVAQDLRAFLAIAGLFRSTDPDCVHLHTSKAGFVGRLASGPAGMRKIYTMHGYDQLRVENSVFVPIDRMLRRFCDAVVAVSRYDERKMRDAGYDPVFIPNGTEGVGRDRDADPRVLARFAALGRSGFPIVLTVARDVRPKRLDIVRELASRFRDRAAFAWIGGAGYGTEHFVPGTLAPFGTVPFASRYMPYADIYLLASDHEGMPVSVVEAMSAGLPCVVSDVGGAGEPLAGGCGFAVHNSADAFSTALDRLLSSPDLRSRMGALARKTWEESYSAERMAVAYETLYGPGGGPGNPAENDLAGEGASARRSRGSGRCAFSR